jgi:hypothetical protein
MMLCPLCRAKAVQCMHQPASTASPTAPDPHRLLIQLCQQQQQLLSCRQGTLHDTTAGHMPANVHFCCALPDTAVPYAPALHSACEAPLLLGPPHHAGSSQCLALFPHPAHPQPPKADSSATNNSRLLCCSPLPSQNNKSSPQFAVQVKRG